MNVYSIYYGHNIEVSITIEEARHRTPTVASNIEIHLGPIHVRFTFKGRTVSFVAYSNAPELIHTISRTVLLVV
jgi:hypothetical protein